MFRRLGTLSATRPIPVILAWIVVTVAVMATAPKLGSVISASHAAYLPASANSRQAEAILSKAFPHSPADSAVVLVTGPRPAREVEVAAISRYAAHGLTPAPSLVNSNSATPQLRPALDSRDGAATMIVLGWSQSDASAAVAPLR